MADNEKMEVDSAVEKYAITPKETIKYKPDAAAIKEKYKNKYKAKYKKGKIDPSNLSITLDEKNTKGILKPEEFQKRHQISKPVHDKLSVDAKRNLQNYINYQNPQQTIPHQGFNITRNDIRHKKITSDNDLLVSEKGIAVPGVTTFAPNYAPLDGYDLETYDRIFKGNHVVSDHHVPTMPLGQDESAANVTEQQAALNQVLIEEKIVGYNEQGKPIFADPTLASVNKPFYEMDDFIKSIFPHAKSKKGKFKFAGMLSSAEMVHIMKKYLSISNTNQRLSSRGVSFGDADFQEAYNDLCMDPALVERLNSGFMSYVLATLSTLAEFYFVTRFWDKSTKAGVRIQKGLLTNNTYFWFVKWLSDSGVKTPKGRNPYDRAFDCAFFAQNNGSNRKYVSNRDWVISNSPLVDIVPGGYDDVVKRDTIGIHHRMSNIAKQSEGQTEDSRADYFAPSQLNLENIKKHNFNQWQSVRLREHLEGVSQKKKEVYGKTVQDPTAHLPISSYEDYARQAQIESSDKNIVVSISL